MKKYLEILLGMVVLGVFVFGLVSLSSLFVSSADENRLAAVSVKLLIKAIEGDDENEFVPACSSESDSYYNKINSLTQDALLSCATTRHKNLMDITSAAGEIIYIKPTVAPAYEIFKRWSSRNDAESTSCKQYIELLVSICPLASKQVGFLQ